MPVTDEELTELPEIDVRLMRRSLTGVRIDAGAEVDKLGEISEPVAAETISDGVQGFLVQNRANGETLAPIFIAAGAPPEAVIRAEIDLLRAELDLLKQAFHRNGSETHGG